MLPDKKPTSPSVILTVVLQAFSGEAPFAGFEEVHSLETMSSAFFHVASTSFTRCSCAVRGTETIPGDGFPSSSFFSYSAINSSFSLVSSLPLLYNRELAAASSSDTGPISTMCVLSVSQRWSFPFPFSSLPSSSLGYTGRVTSSTFLLSSPIVAVMNPLRMPFTSSPCLLVHTRESVPSASVHDSPMSPDSYTLRRPSPHAVIMMSFSSFSHSTTEGSLQPSSGASFDSFQLLVASVEYMISETVVAFTSPSLLFAFFVPSTGNTSLSPFISNPDPPLPISSSQD
ncbi:hypothetical protein TCDM_10161 [Trypanosoma cruzi Dm28c]|uniref:Uncharacterized protein n=1 Tax=Trypanosoma cruzi Dm28c TaxID=1416333 RepID=V5D400_TRYCR|nr:hypothetical protein TCDM_10161 [Trypanosoma cruzi Dm28c]